MRSVDFLGIGLVGLSVLGTGIPVLAEPVAFKTELPGFLPASTVAQDLRRSLDQTEAGFTDSKLTVGVQLAQTQTESSPAPASQSLAQTPTDQTPDTQPPTTSQTPYKEPIFEEPNGDVDDFGALTAPNHIGVGGSLGIADDAFGDTGAFALISKLRLFSIFSGPDGSTDLSVRPSVIVGQDVTVVVPFTVDLVLPGVSFADISSSAVIPYFGPGFVFTTDDDIFYFNLTGGLEVPIGQFTANTALNIGFLDDVAVGVTLGVGYNF